MIDKNYTGYLCKIVLRILLRNKTVFNT